MTTPPLPEQIELHCDRMWRRDEDLRVESAVDAERFIEDVGFANTLTDARRAGHRSDIAVCGRRDVSLPRSIQKEAEERRDTRYREKNPGSGQFCLKSRSGIVRVADEMKIAQHFSAGGLVRIRVSP